MRALFLVLMSLASMLDVVKSKVQVQKCPILRQIEETVGGEARFEVEMGKILEHASSLHNGQQSHITPVKNGTRFLNGEFGIVARICFTDGECWAAKVSPKGRFNCSGMEFGIKSLQAVEAHCPKVSTPRIYGFSLSGPICYLFMEWIEGISLAEDEGFRQQLKLMKGTHPVNVSVSENLVTQLATFLYHLNTCQIPKHKSKLPTALFNES